MAVKLYREGEGEKVEGAASSVSPPPQSHCKAKKTRLETGGIGLYLPSSLGLGVCLLNMHRFLDLNGDTSVEMSIKTCQNLLIGIFLIQKQWF